MVYNAMKMFMEINPQLFDDCSQEYTERQNTKPTRERSRKERWEKLSQLARDRKNSVTQSTTSTTQVMPTPDPTPKSENVDPLGQDNVERLQSLKLDDDATTPSKERRLREREGQNSVSVSSPVG